MKKLKIIALSALLTTLTLVTACSSSTTPKIDLSRVLDITESTLYSFDKDIGGTTAIAKLAASRGSIDESVAVEELSAENQKINNEAMLEFARVLQIKLNRANPQIHPEMIGINIKDDGSIQGYSDGNKNDQMDAGERELFIVEVDSGKSRLIASAGEYVTESGFSGSGLLAGMLIGSMLSRQRGAGVNQKSLSNKKAMSKSSYKSARSRSGSGSHTKGK